MSEKPIQIPVHRPYLGAEELAAVGRVFDSRWLGLGSVTKQFEEQLCAYLGVRHVIAVNTGTAALHTALDALDLQPGDEVLVPSLTFVSTVQAILAVAARPVFCEVRPETLTLDVHDAERRLTPRTRAVLPVHYGGLPCAMNELASMAQERDMWVVEDAAHAFGSAYQGQMAGALGDIACFSFDPIKNITCGGGGAVATNNDELASRIHLRRNVGISTDSWDRLGDDRPWFYNVVAPGFRYSMSNLNAAIGLEQLKRMGTFRERKQAIVRRYDAAFQAEAGLALIEHNLPKTFPFSYVVRVLDGRRDLLIRYLAELGIGSTVQFIPNHLQPAFAAYRVDLPVTEQLYGEILTLPLYYEMSDHDVETVIAAVRSFLRQAPGRSRDQVG
jgi:perosamine synthetase